MSGQLIQVLMDIFKGIFIIVLMFVINVELALISMVLIPIFFIAAQIFKMKVKSAFRETRKQMSNVTQKAQENISGMKVIKSYGKEEKAAAEFDDANKQNTAAMLKVRKIFAFYFPIIQFITSIFSTMILLYAGIAIQDGISLFGSVITIGTFMVFNTYLAQFFQPLFAITMFQQFVESALASAERIYLLLSEDTELSDPATPAQFDDVHGKIEYNHVQFSYPKRKVKTEGMTMADLYTTSFGNQNTKKQGIKQKMMQKMMEKKSTMSKMFGMNGSGASRAQDPQMILKLANTLDSQLRGSLKLGAGGSGGGGDGAGGMGGNGGMPGGQSMMNKEMIMNILSDPNIPTEIQNQFTPLVKQTIEEFRKMKERNAASGDVFKDLQFTIEQGKTIGIVGETGAGKTTLVKLIPRFYEIQSGEILVDGINTKQVSKQKLRNKIGMVPQDSFLFSDTIENNLLYGIDSSSTDPIEMEKHKAKMVEIAQFLGLDNFIQRMPQKYGTKLLENASNISIGQRQLIAFARVLLLDPKILILDEATSSVDPYTETLIQDALDKVRKGRTTLIIAHRLSTIKNADEIFVLANGELIERGTHSQLMEKNGKYAQLVKNQASG
jgi:ABC-type multidrug transport system fused ATPase/permease subunit